MAIATVHSGNLDSFVVNEVPPLYSARVNDVPVRAGEALSWMIDWQRRGFRPVLLKNVDGYRIFGHDCYNSNCVLAGNCLITSKPI